MHQVLQTLLGQCKKKDLSYRTTAIECTGDALESLKINVFHDFSEIIYAILEPASTHYDYYCMYIQREILWVT